LLEIGCAYGFFLALARQYWQVRGIDVHDEAVRYAREHLGVEARCGEFLDIVEDQRVWDVVAMWGTVALLRDPASYLEKIARLLTPGGIVALTTADASSLLARLQGRQWRFTYPPYQLHGFTRASMRRLLERVGLEVVEMQAIGAHRSLNQMLYRTLRYERGRVGQACYRLIHATGLTRRLLYLNLGDFMLVIARRARP
jgi:2-polyprenyl-3-methyl-5-hydroxy-6-metoxy-1,4-benzoquinol methylase